MQEIVLLFGRGEVAEILKHAGMDGFVPGAIRLEDAPKLVESAQALDLITDSRTTIGVKISNEGDLAVQIDFTSGVRLMSEWTGDHFLKHLVHIDMPNDKIANRLLSWAVGEAERTIDAFDKLYAPRST